MSEILKKWYVVRAITGNEKKVKQYLESEISRLNLAEYISQILIPTEKVYQVRNENPWIIKIRLIYPKQISP